MLTTYKIKTEERPRIDVKTAVRRALRYVAELYEGQPVADIALEEVEHDSANWYITVGLTRRVTRPQSRRLPLRDLSLVETNPLTEREYKIVRVDAATGEPKSMKIRQL